MFRTAYPFDFSFSIWHLTLPPIGVLAGLYSAVFLHNAAHSNFRPRWLNRLVGEFCGFHQLYGFAAWSILHMAHHQFPDDPEKDPHPPEGLTFLEFSMAMKGMARRSLKRNFQHQWGGRGALMLLWAAKDWIAIAGIWTKALAWLLLLGPTAFLLGYLPSYLATFWFFAYFNYFTHREGSDGRVEIVDLDDSLFHQIVNRFFFGVFFHETHHRKPSLFNPMQSSPQR